MIVLATADAAVPLQLTRLDCERDSVPSVPNKTRVLIADANVRAAQLLGDQLVREGYVCEIALNAERALDAIRDGFCNIVVCEAQMVGSNEFEVLDQIRLLRPQLPIIVGGHVVSIAEAVEAVKHGAFQYLETPFNFGALLEIIVQAAATVRPQPTTAPPPRSSVPVGMGELVHVSPVMRELVESIALVARSNAAVLILGESGTGKERVARAIHGGGPRASQPFVAVNTSAIPEQLLESEVFGHVRGAFTGATQARRGLLAEAHGGTVLLDEIGDMPIALQPKLLRVLQFGEMRAVGSDRIGHVDVRIIAATHRDLNALVHEGRFREDLRYRINVIPLVVPPLRERREDILPLVELFLREAQSRTVASPVIAIDEEAMNTLVQASWPGNVRELENAIERLVVLGREPVITKKHLSFLQEQPPGESWPAVEGTPWTLKQMNQHYLDWVLNRTGGDKSRTAAILNIDLSTLYRWERAKP